MFNGPIEKDMVVNHIDCNVLNNKIENLEICTEAENARRRKEHKLHGKTRNSKTGINGVVYRENKHGGRWVAHWTEDNKLKTKSYSVAKYGYEGAKQKAISTRIESIDFLIKQGHGYK